MATAICVKSGLVFNIQYFPFTFDGSTINSGIRLHHPVFDLEYRDLVSEPLMSRYLDRRFNNTDLKLYFLALLHSSNLINWNHPATPSTATIESNMMNLLNILDWMHAHQYPVLNYPRIAISEDTADCKCACQWIKAWESVKEEFETGSKTLNKMQALIRKESTLERLIRTKQEDPANYAGLLADWALLSGEAPETTRDYKGNLIEAAPYWKSLIVTCGKSDNHVWRLNLEDLEDLLAWLESNIDAGSIYGHAVLSLVRLGIDKHKNYLGFTLLGSSRDEVGNIHYETDPTSSEAALDKILAADAPETEPLPANYPDKVSYIQARIRWNKKIQLESASNINN